MDTWTTVTHTVYQRLPQGAVLAVRPADMEAMLRLVDVVQEVNGPITGHVYQRYSDGAFFLFPSRPPDVAQHPYPPSARRIGYPVFVSQSPQAGGTWLFRVATYGHHAAAVITAPSEEAARALFSALDFDAPDEVHALPPLAQGVIAYEHSDWDDRDD